MKWTRINCLFALIAATCGVLGMPADVVAGGGDDEHMAEAIRADSAAAYPEKLPERDRWESVISFPGDLIDLPFEIVFNGTSWAIERIDESRIIPRVIDLLTFESFRAGFVPVYSSRTGAGMQFFAKGLGSEEAKFSLSLAAGLRDRRCYQIRWKRLEPFGGPAKMDFRVRYHILSDERFFGIGTGTAEELENDYSHEQTTGSVSLMIPFNRRVSVDVGIRYDLSTILGGKNPNVPSTTDRFTGETLAGLEKQLGLVGGSVALFYDSRNFPGSPSRGMTIRTSAGMMTQTAGSRYGFWKVSADVTRYVHLVHNRKLVLRVLAEATDAFTGREIPFYYLSELGSEETIRGFKRGRYRDNDLAAVSFEYRYPIWRIIDALLFVDGGTVVPSLLHDWTLESMHWGFGGGIRIWNHEGEIVSLKVAKGPELVRVYFSLFSGE